MLSYSTTPSYFSALTKEPFERITFEAGMTRQKKQVSPQEIAKLAARAAGGDSTAFAALVRMTQSFAYSLAFRLLGNEPDARDVVQEAYASVWEHLKEFDTSRMFTTWLYTIVSNAGMDHLRRRKRSQNLFSEASVEPMDPRDPSKVHSNDELAEIIRKLTGDLPPTQKLVFTLRDLQDCSVQEVTEITGISEGSVKVNLHLARKRIREILGKKYGVKEST